MSDGTKRKTAVTTTAAAVASKLPPFDEHHIIMGTLELTTHAADGTTLKMIEVQEAMVSAIAHLQGSDPHRETVFVNLYSGAADPQFGDVFKSKPGRSLMENEVFDHTTHYKMVAVATSKDTASMISDAMKASTTTTQESPLAEATKAAFYASTGIEIGHLSTTKDQQLFVPAYNSKKMLTHNRRHLGLHSTMLVDPAQPAVPLTHVGYEKKYQLYLENFAPLVWVHVDVCKMKGEGEEEEEGVEEVKKVQMDKEGKGVLEYVFHAKEEGEEAHGHYFFQASVVQDGETHTQNNNRQLRRTRAVQGFSSTYFVSHEEQEKKLYGPSMRI